MRISHSKPSFRRWSRRSGIFAAAHDCHIPVIAGGGIYTGEDIYEILSLGAEGVQMGTRFVTTEECDAAPAFKQSYLDARETDIESSKVRSECPDARSTALSWNG